MGGYRIKAGKQREDVEINGKVRNEIEYARKGRQRIFGDHVRTEMDRSEGGENSMERQGNRENGGNKKGERNKIDWS
jgi:hypothetical protein